MTSASERIGELYAEPLDRFTEARNALATALKEEGDAAAAKEVKALKKPSVGAWALNRLARTERGSLQELLEVREQMRDANSPKQLRELGGKRRGLIAHLVEASRSILEEGGHAASASTMQAITQTLQAGLTDEEREQLLEGRLTRELSSTGIEEMFGMSVEDAPAPRGPSQRQIREAKRFQDEAAVLEREADRATSAAEDAARAAQAAADHAARARRRAESARRKADEATAEVEGT